MARETLEPVVVEPWLVEETFATGVTPPEDHGDFIRIAVFTDRRTGGQTERLVVARFVFAASAFRAALSQVVRAIPAIN